MESDRIDGDLVLCPAKGFAYQADREPMPYQDPYLDKFDAYDAAIALRVNVGRRNMVARHLAGKWNDPHAWRVLDWGCGDGSFLRHACASGFDCFGYEVIPQTVAWLKKEEVYSDDVESFRAVTAWDVIEHLPEPQKLLDRCRDLLFVSVPIFTDLARIRESRHYRPGEHLWHFTDAGLVSFFAENGFKLLERSTHETDAGRDSIGAYAFQRIQ